MDVYDFPDCRVEVRSKGSLLLPYSVSRKAVDLKIGLVFFTPGKPQGRGRVERFFGTLNEMFLCDLDG